MQASQCQLRFLHRIHQGYAINSELGLFHETEAMTCNIKHQNHPLQQNIFKAHCMQKNMIINTIINQTKNNNKKTSFCLLISYVIHLPDIQIQI